MVTFSVAITSTLISLKNLESGCNITKEVSEIPRNLYNFVREQIRLSNRDNLACSSGLITADERSDFYLWYLAEK
jgi:hypothetical protein